MWDRQPAKKKTKREREFLINVSELEENANKKRLRLTSNSSSSQAHLSETLLLSLLDTEEYLKERKNKIKIVLTDKFFIVLSK